MKPRYKITLTEDERSQLEGLTHSGKTAAPKVYPCARVAAVRCRTARQPLESRRRGRSVGRHPAHDRTSQGALRGRGDRSRVGAQTPHQTTETFLRRRI